MTDTIVGTTPQEFFGKALDEAMDRERVHVGVFTRQYVVQLLVRQIDQGYHPDETLSDRFALAMQARQADRVRILCEVGDRALVASGLWWEHEFRPLRPSHATLHIDLGRLAYRSVGGVPFIELSANIAGIVDALIRLGTDHSLVTARDVLRLYLLWEETHSPHAAKALAAKGLSVVPYQQQAPS